MLVRIANTPRPYAWGSHTAIPEFLGTEVTDQPQAELWLGAHTSNPSRILDEQVGYPDLSSWIGAEPSSALGSDEAEAQLPFLLKILAADSPLSLQAHPTAQQAAAGYAAEELAGIEIDAPHRNYKDPLAKPEIIVALSQKFEALSGFRQLAEVSQILQILRAAGQELGLEDLRPLDLLETLLGVENPLETTVGVLLGGQHADSVAALTDLVVRLSSSQATRTSAFAASFATVIDVAGQYPGDPGVVLTLLLNRVSLTRGEALFLDAGNIHAYLSGLGIELMGASDNVMRGGLTSKHVAVTELSRVLNFESMPAPYLPAVHSGENITSYVPEGTGFALHRLENNARLELSGPAISIMESGQLQLSGKQGRALAQRGESHYLTPDEEYVHCSGQGVLWMATTV